MNAKQLLHLVVCALALLVAEAQHHSPMYALLSGAAAYHHAPSNIHYDANAPDPRHLAHKAVVENAAVEAELPQELVNDFYKNPHIAAGLAKESWFGDKEFPVFHRQADKIPREEIVKIIKRIQHQERRRR